MKKSILLLSICMLGVFASGQNLTYTFQDGYMNLKRSGTSIFTLPLVGASVDTVQRPPAYTSCYMVFKSSGKSRFTLVYSASDDSITGRTAIAARNILNQAMAGARGNYLGAWKKSQLISSDTATVGNYYYDTDSTAFRVKRASGGFITITTNQ